MTAINWVIKNANGVSKFLGVNLVEDVAVACPTCNCESINAQKMKPLFENKIDGVCFKLTF